MLATSSWPGPGWFPGWLAGAIAFVGFLAFLVLAGFASLLGNAVAGVLIVVWLRGVRGWPLWGAALVALPYWVVFCRLVPTPW